MQGPSPGGTTRLTHILVGFFDGTVAPYSQHPDLILLDSLVNCVDLSDRAPALIRRLIIAILFAMIEIALCILKKKT